MEYLELKLLGLNRELPVTLLSPRKSIANFSILGDVEFTSRAAVEIKRILQESNLLFDCFVGPEVKVVPLIHELAKMYQHSRYVVLRKSVRGYMVNPIVLQPPRKAPMHVKKLVLNGNDASYLKGKKVVLIDDVVSTGSTMDLLEEMMERVGAETIAKCAIFKQGDDYKKDIIHLAELPIIINS